MEIRVLRYFLTVAREEGITRAAQALHITQPTLSRQISQLEEEVGVKLFDRSKGKLRLTNEGLLLCRRAEEILALVDKTERELIRQEAELEGVISIGSGELSSVDVLGDLCASFHEKYPKVRFDLYTATADVVRERIERGVTDVGLLLEPVDMEKFAFLRLKTRERWCVLMRADDPLACRDKITVKELENLPLCLPRRLNVQSEVAVWFGDAFPHLNVVFTSNLSTNAAIMAMKGIVYPLVIDGSVPLLDTKKLVSIPLCPELTATSVLAWKREQPFGRAAERFIQFAKCFLGMDSTYNPGN